MGHVERTITINRPVEEVFEFVTDLRNAPKWDAGVLEASQTSSGPLGVGSTLELVASALGRKVRVAYQVVEFESNHSFALSTNSAPVKKAISRYAFEAVPEGTELSQTWDGSLRFPWNLFWPFLSRAALKDFPNIKRILEAGSSPD